MTWHQDQNIHFRFGIRFCASIIFFHWVLATKNQFDRMSCNIKWNVLSFRYGSIFAHVNWVLLAFCPTKIPVNRNTNTKENKKSTETKKWTNWSQNQIHIIYYRINFSPFPIVTTQRTSYSCTSVYMAVFSLAKNRFMCFQHCFYSFGKVIIKRQKDDSLNPRNAESIRIYMKCHKVLVCICTVNGSLERVSKPKFCPFAVSNVWISMRFSRKNSFLVLSFYPNTLYTYGCKYTIHNTHGRSQSHIHINISIEEMNFEIRVLCHWVIHSFQKTEDRRSVLIRCVCNFRLVKCEPKNRIPFRARTLALLYTIHIYMFTFLWILFCRCGRMSRTSWYVNLCGCIWFEQYAWFKFY